jgi:hypothetical protein
MLLRDLPQDHFSTVSAVIGRIATRSDHASARCGSSVISFGKQFTGGEEIAAARFGTEKALEPLARVSASAVKYGLSRRSWLHARAAHSDLPSLAR